MGRETLQDFGWGVRDWAWLLALSLSGSEGNGPLLPRGFTATVELLSVAAASTVGKPLLVRAAVKLGPY